MRKRSKEEEVGIRERKESQQSLNETSKTWNPFVSNFLPEVVLLVSVQVVTVDLSVTTHSKKINFGGSRDVISSLPDALSCHILSFLPTKEAASTSVLSKRWKHLLAFVPNLEFDDSIYMHPRVTKQEKEEFRTSFMDFVDSVLALKANAPLNRFHLKCKDVVDPYRVFDWIPKVLERGVLDLDLYTSLEWDGSYSESGYYPLPSEIFVSKTLVRLKIGVRDGVSIDMEDDVSLPKLKTLHLDHVWIETGMFAKLFSSCHELEELVLINLMSDSYETLSVSNKTLKRLKLSRSKDCDSYIQSMSFDTPNLVYLEYSEDIAVEYPQASFDSLVEAYLGLRMSPDQIKRVRYAEDVEAETDGEMIIGDVTNFLMGICNVRILYLSDDTLQVLNYCCETVPVFDNLVHLTIKTHEDVGWTSLPSLLKNCPILETLIFQGLHHKCLNTCGDSDGCICKDCLSSSPVKVLKILFGDDDTEGQINQVKHFLETMPNLEQLTLYNIPSDEDVIKFSSQLQMLPKVASPKCKIQVVSDNLSLTSTLSTKWGPLLYKINSDLSAMDMSPATSFSSW